MGRLPKVGQTNLLKTGNSLTPPLGSIISQPLRLLSIEISGPRTAEGADQAEAARGSPGDHVLGATETAGLAQQAAGGGGRKYHRHQGAPRYAVDDFTLARRRSEPASRATRCTGALACRPQ